MEKELNSFDLNELEDEVSAVMIQTSMLSYNFIRHGVYRLLLSRDVRYLMDEVIDQYCEQQLDKSQAMAAIEQHRYDLMEQKQQLNVNGIEFVADAMAQHTAILTVPINCVPRQRTDIPPERRTRLWILAMWVRAGNTLRMPAAFSCFIMSPKISFASGCLTITTATR